MKEFFIGHLGLTMCIAFFISLLIAAFIWWKGSSNSSTTDTTSHPGFAITMIVLGAFLSSLLSLAITSYSEDHSGNEKATALVKIAIFKGFDETYDTKEKLSQSEIDVKPFNKILDTYELHQYYDEEFINNLNEIINMAKESNKSVSEKTNFNEEFTVGYSLFTGTLRNYFNSQYLLLNKDISKEEYRKDLLKMGEQLKIAQKMMKKNQ